MTINYGYEAKSYGTKRAETKYIVIHYTGNAKDTALANAKYFHNNHVSAGAHFFVDASGVWASTPEDCTSWSVGKLYNSKHAPLWKKCTNHNSINVELADDAGKSKPTQATINNALELTREMMKKYNIGSDRVVRHWDVCGKKCPAYWTDDEKWNNEFKRKLASGGDSAKTQTTTAKSDKSTSQAQNKPKSGGLTIDGIWGKNTNKALQKRLGTVQDGIISHQTVGAKKKLISISASAWQFDSTRKGSLCIKALQKKLGVSADGLIGENTIKALQRKLGVTADGIAGKNTVKALQRRLS